MVRILVAMAIILANPAWAECTGTDLIATLPDDRRAELRAEAAAAPYSQGILWEASGDGRQLHIVGTMHVHDPRHDATMARIAPFLESADAVFLELGDGDEAKLQRMIAEEPSLAFITEGPTLPELLTPATWDALRTALSLLGVPGFLAAKMKPWMAMANLGLSACDLQNLQQGKRGLDGRIMDRARELGKPARALEPIDTALRIFSEFTPEEQIEMLEVGLAQQGRDSADQGTTVTEAYFREEIQLIWEWSVMQSLAMPGATEQEVMAQIGRLERALVTQRNRAWLDRILETEGDLLIAAGAMHLPGENGLLRLLEEAGYSVTRLSRTP